MSQTSQDRTFTAAMVQMRTGLLPEPSLEQATRLIRQAVANGANRFSCQSELMQKLKTGERSGHDCRLHYSRRK